MSDDVEGNPSAGLVPDIEGPEDMHRLEDETPDTLGDPMDDDSLENELPEEGVTPEEVAFERDLEGDLEQETEDSGPVPGDDPLTGERTDHDFDLEQEIEDEEIKRYRES